MFKLKIPINYLSTHIFVVYVVGTYKIPILGISYIIKKSDANNSNTNNNNNKMISEKIA